MRAAAIMVMFSACAAAPRDHLPAYGFTDPVACADDACRAVETRLAELASRETTFYQCAGRIMVLGERAVPTLTRELDGESLQRLQISAYILTALGHADDVLAWCRRAGGDLDGRDLACAAE